MPATGFSVGTSCGRVVSIVIVLLTLAHMGRYLCLLLAYRASSGPQGGLEGPELGLQTVIRFHGC
jgi:hypothetical protein